MIYWSPLLRWKPQEIAWNGSKLVYDCFIRARALTVWYCVPALFVVCIKLIHIEVVGVYLGGLVNSVMVWTGCHVTFVITVRKGHVCDISVVTLVRVVCNRSSWLNPDKAVALASIWWSCCWMYAVDRLILVPSCESLLAYVTSASVRPSSSSLYLLSNSINLE